MNSITDYLFGADTPIIIKAGLIMLMFMALIFILILSIKLNLKMNKLHIHSKMTSRWFIFTIKFEVSKLSTISLFKFTGNSILREPLIISILPHITNVS